jgi:hypothetical protein
MKSAIVSVVALVVVSGCTTMTHHVDRFVTDLRVTRDGLQVERCDVVHRIELMWSAELVPGVGGLLGLLYSCRMTSSASWFRHDLHYTTYYVCSFQKEDCTSTRYPFDPGIRVGETP